MPLTWITKVIYVDLETGEILPKEKVSRLYTVVKTTKTKFYNATRTIGYITRTNECSRHAEQGKFQF